MDEPAEPEEEEVEDDASDGDEYVGERGDEASEAEDATMEDVSVPNASTRSTQRRTQPSASSSRTYQGIARAKVAPTDKQAPRRPSESTRRPSSSSTLTSSSKKTAARKPTGPSDASTEEARSRARKVLASALENIFSSSDAKQVQVEAKEDEENEVSLAEAFAALLEEELFETNADLHGSVRIVGSKYKDRFRTFLFSLKDAKNTTLHSRIASGELQASELAKMSNEELANDSIRQATEKARLDSLHRSTLRSEEAGPLRKITHKGEIEIEAMHCMIATSRASFRDRLSFLQHVSRKASRLCRRATSRHQTMRRWRKGSKIRLKVVRVRHKTIWRVDLLQRPVSPTRQAASTLAMYGQRMQTRRTRTEMLNLESRMDLMLAPPTTKPSGMA